MVHQETPDKLSDRWRFLPLEQATSNPKGGICQVIRDNWWLVHPEKGLLFFWSQGTKGLGSPRCNRSESIVRRVGTTCEGAEIRFLPLAIVPIDLSDYK